MIGKLTRHSSEISFNTFFMLGKSIIFHSNRNTNVGIGFTMWSAIVIPTSIQFRFKLMYNDSILNAIIDLAMKTLINYICERRIVVKFQLRTLLSQYEILFKICLKYFGWKINFKRIELISAVTETSVLACHRENSVNYRVM